MAYNNAIQPSRPNITEILGKMRSSEYYVDRSFQRRLVWTERQKVRLIETVLMAFPMPEIYLWEQAPDAETGRQSFSIVDGQQRLSTLREFTSNEWPLKLSYLDEAHKNEPYADKYWKDLSPELRAHFYQYNINARRIPSDVPEKEIRRIFARLNETDRSLNPQELRHATLNGEFLTASLELADSPEMRSFKIFSRDNIRRMADVEFASQLLGYERKGIVSDTPESMNDLYDEFSDKYADKNSDMRNILRTLTIICEIFKDQTIKNFFETQNYIYTLHSLIDTHDDVSVEYWKNALAKFVVAYENLNLAGVDSRGVDDNLLAFQKGASSRTRSKTSRTQRLFGLKRWIEANAPTH